MSRANKLALIEEIRAVAPKVYDGTYTWADGRKYEGAFRDGFFLGKGWKGR